MHNIEIRTNTPETYVGAACGYDINLEIDGKPFKASSITIKAEAGSKLVTASVEFAVRDLVVDGKNIETTFSIPGGGDKPRDRAPIYISRDEYLKVVDEVLTHEVSKEIEDE